MNSNITQVGIRKNPERMQRVGMGDLQNFDVRFAVPVIVDERIPYMCEAWKEVCRYSVDLAEELGLEFGIAASPGWSETGGPRVEPEDGMKKLVWRETLVEGGSDSSGVIPSPPSVTGPFQDLSPPRELNPTPKAEDPVHHADIAVLAYRNSTSGAVPSSTIALADGKKLDAAAA